nr:tRNA pseudouridine(38-40) synthase TruA [candidate division Zixibacteria bacterium]
MAEKNIRLEIQYNGTDYSGWQVQKNAVTIQAEIEAAIRKVTGLKVNLVAAGRTDAGVHALGQVASFIIDHYLPPEKYRQALNFYLPESILITSASEVDLSFHARKSARWREYRYLIGLEKSALYRQLRWEYLYPLDIERMNAIAAEIIGRHDFSAFCVVSSLKENNDCEVISSGWKENGSQLIFEIRANRFLHTMVRSLVGSMVEAGKEKDYLTLNDFRDILQSCDHRRVKAVAPARGLYLTAVGY